MVFHYISFHYEIGHLKMRNTSDGTFMIIAILRTMHSTNWVGVPTSAGM